MSGAKAATGRRNDGAISSLEWLGFINSELHKTSTPLWQAESPTATKDAAREMLGKRFRYLDHHLATYRYLLGAIFTLPDAYCFTVVNWSNSLQLDVMPYPKLKRYMNEIEAVLPWKLPWWPKA